MLAGSVCEGAVPLHRCLLISALTLWIVGLSDVPRVARRSSAVEIDTQKTQPEFTILGGKRLVWDQAGDGF